MSRVRCPCSSTRPAGRTQRRAAEEGHLDGPREAREAEEPALDLDSVQRRVPFDRRAHAGTVRTTGHCGHSYPPAPRALRHFAAYGSANKYRPVSRSKASGSSPKRPTQTACCSRTKTTMLTMTATVNAMDSQRWICRTHVFQFNDTSSEDERAGGLQPARAKTCSRFAKNFRQPYWAPW